MPTNSQTLIQTLITKMYKRRRFINIKNDFQKKLLIGFFLFMTGGGVLFNVLLKQVPTANWLLLLIGGGCVMAGCLFLSRRIVGPLYRFELTLDNMLKGRLNNRIHLRDKDEGKLLAQKINEFNIQISQSFKTIGQNSKALHILIEQVSALDLPESEKEQLASLCWSMHEHNRKITNNCSFYQE